MEQSSRAVVGPLDRQVRPLVDRLRTDVLWHRRRGNETVARDCQEAADEIERLLGANERMREDCADAGNALADAEDDEELLRQALEALEHHLEQTRPIERTEAAIAALRGRLGPNVLVSRQGGAK